MEHTSFQIMALRADNITVMESVTQAVLRQRAWMGIRHTAHAALSIVRAPLSSQHIFAQSIANHARSGAFRVGLSTI